MIVNIVVGTTARVERTRIFVAFATIARKKILPRVTSEVVPIVVCAHPRQDLIVQRLGSCLLLLRGHAVAVQIATVVQIVQARLRYHVAACCWTVGQVVDHIRGTETAGTTSGSIVELRLRLQVRLVVSGSVLIGVVVRRDWRMMFVQLLMYLVLLLVNCVVSGVNVNVSEIAIATVAAIAAVGRSCVSIRVRDVSIVALDLLIDGVLLV